MSAHPVRFGLVGFGAWGRHHAQSIASHPEAQLVAIVVPSETSRAAAAKAHPQAKITWSYTPYPHDSHSTIYHPAATRAVREVFPAEVEKKP